MKKYRLKYTKSHFVFGLLKNRSGKIYIRKTYTNVFITFCDMKDRVVSCFTSGSSKISKSKRRKRIAQAVEKIMIYVNRTLKFYNIKKIHLVLKMRIRSHVYTLLSRLKYYGFEIVSFCSKKSIAHNGIRGRKLRRL